MKEQREFRRLHIQLPMRIRGTDRRGQSVDIISFTENVSTGGAYFLHSEPLETGTHVDVFLAVPYETSSHLPLKTLGSEAVVVRVATTEGERRDQTGIALKFVKDLTWKSEISESK